MFVELELARARLAYRADLAAAVRRQCGLEWTGSGYKARVRTRKVGMEQQTMIPRGVDKIHVLWTDPKQGTATVEWSDGVRCFYATVPIIEVRRHDRQAGRRVRG